MSFRVTRSSTRRSAGSASQNSPPSPPPPLPPPPSSSRPAPASSRKRKVAAREPGPEQPEHIETAPPRRGRAKRTKINSHQSPTQASSRPRRALTEAVMSSAGPSTNATHEKPTSQPATSKRSRSCRKSSGGDNSRQHTKASTTENNLGGPSTPRRKSPRSARRDVDTGMEDAPQSKTGDDTRALNEHHTSEDEHEDGTDGRYDEEEDDEDDPFTSGFLGRHPHSLATLRQLTGMMASTTQRLRGILDQLRSSDMSVQLIALQELSEVLLISTEDNLAGHFSPDTYVKELVKLMHPNEFTGEENPELMLLACRCLANLMEALPAATANVVYGGAVPVLCSKLLEINFIDLAEQCLSTLEKISVEFPAAIVREGGLTACLTFLDFFATSTQRTAVTTAANCCRNIPEDSFPVVRDVMPILENILGNNDQKVVEQGCICVSRIVQSFRHQESKLEQLVSTGLLKAILRLLLPGTTNLIGTNIHTMFLQVLAYTAKASPRLSAELLKMHVVDTLYQILTGVSPPGGTEDVAAKIDSVIIMQALIHRPKDQVYETLNVICELLPNVPEDGLMYLEDLYDAGYPGDELRPLASTGKQSANEQRVQQLDSCKPEVKRFAVILLPTLTDAYSSTVNLGVRQKVLTAHLKMISNLDTDILEEALRPVPYASHLASIFSQQDHPSLVTYALQATELLLKRLEPIYRYQFYREGVIYEISRLADRPCKTLDAGAKNAKMASGIDIATDSGHSTASSVEPVTERESTGVESDVCSDIDEDEEDADEDENENSDNEDDEDESDSSSSSSSSDHHIATALPNMEDIITLRAKKFIEVHEQDTYKFVRDKASAVLDDLTLLAKEIRACTLSGQPANCMKLFTRLAAYFEGDALESITSFELKSSKIVETLLEVFSLPSSARAIDPRPLFLEAFTNHNRRSTVKPVGTAPLATPFSVLVHKLQDLLSRSEHFDVITVHQNSHDSRGSATSMLAKQLRLKLVADDESGIPKTYRNIMVSIHAIATFKALDDYLRPRISIAERPRPNKITRDQLTAFSQSFSEGRTLPLPHTPIESNNRSKKSARSKVVLSDPSQSGSSSASREKTRRSSRRQPTQLPPPPPPPLPSMPLSSSHQDPVECADEERLSDQDSVDDNSALSAIVDDLQDGLDVDAPDPSAVNVEVAPTGQATAHKEDGTRVATPVQSTTFAKSPSENRTPSSRLTALLQSSAMRHSFGNAVNALSYAAAVQSTPQDWHIEFSVNGQPLSNETTIYRAVHFNQAQPPDTLHRIVWNATHTIKFKRVQGPPPSSGSNPLSPTPQNKLDGAGIPLSLDQQSVTSAILQLLSTLHNLNSHLDEILLDNEKQIKISAESLSQFVNTKLTAKLNRQLEEPLIVASNCLPSWSEDLARFYPFLFPFETRHLFLQSTSFGYSRSMTRWQNSQPASNSRHDRHRDERPFLGRLQRQKVRISRSRILESAMKVMQLYGHSTSVLEVEYFEEVGTGLGPTLEFYSTVSKEFSSKKLKLWRENDAQNYDEYAFGKHGLYPAPMSASEATSENGEKRLELFKVLGKFVARSMLDSRIIDVSFNPAFFRIDDGSGTAMPPSLGSIVSLDQDLAKSLVLVKHFADSKKRIDEDGSLSAAQRAEAMQNVVIQDCRVEDLALDFTLPGYSSIELIEQGADTLVTMENVCTYVDKIIDLTLGSGVQRQAAAFRAGFSEVFPYSALKAFTPDELVMLFGTTYEDWSLETLMDSIKADHGYNLDSKSVRNLLHTMSEFDMQQRRDFLQFITGSPKLPIGGFKALTPMFTVVCKPSEPPYTSDDYLPSVMTCVNYLKMPDYSSIDVLREKLCVAIKEGQGAFHLS